MVFNPVCNNKDDFFQEERLDPGTSLLTLVLIFSLQWIGLQIAWTGNRWEDAKMLAIPWMSKNLMYECCAKFGVNALHYAPKGYLVLDHDIAWWLLLDDVRDLRCRTLILFDPENRQVQCASKREFYPAILGQIAGSEINVSVWCDTVYFGSDKRKWSVCSENSSALAELLIYIMSPDRRFNQAQSIMQKTLDLDSQVFQIQREATGGVIFGLYYQQVSIEEWVRNALGV